MLGGRGRFQNSFFVTVGGMKYTSQNGCKKQWTAKWPYIANAVFRIATNNGEKSYFRWLGSPPIALPRSALGATKVSIVRILEKKSKMPSVYSNNSPF